MNYTEIADNAPTCFGCRKSRDHTFVLAHRNRNAWGLTSGRGIKGLSLNGAILCSECHSYGDGEGHNDHDFWELSTMRTREWAWNQGYLKFVTNGGEPDGKLR